MIYRKEALLHQKKQRIATTDDSFSFQFFHISYKLLWKNFHFLQKSSIFALKNLNINHGKKT